MALKWKRHLVEIRTDFVSVCRWVESIVTGDKRIKVKGISEALLRRRLGLIQQIMTEYGLNLKIILVPSVNNVADALTRVPVAWLRLARSSCAVALGEVLNNSELTREDIKQGHEKHHLGLERTMFLLKQEYKDRNINKNLVKDVISTCHRCCSIDPAPIRWEQGNLDVDEVWERVAIDVTHYLNKKFLTLIDCGPSKHTVC